jgi:Fe2+ transport system protein FeoA
MKLTLKDAERKRTLRVTGFSEHMCEFGNNQLADFGIKEGVTLETDPAFVSELILEFGDRPLILGYVLAMGVMVDGGRLTNLQPGTSGKISAFEAGHEANEIYKGIGLEKGKEIVVKKYVQCTGPTFVLIQNQHVALTCWEGSFLHNNDLYTYELPGEAVLVHHKDGPTQVPLLAVGETGLITQVLATETHLEEFDRHWIKPESELKVLQRLERDPVPLLVRVGEREHLLGEHLTPKIYVEYL